MKPSKKSNMFIITCASIGALRSVIIQFFMWLQKEQQKDTKIQLKLARKRCRSRKAILCPSKIRPSSNAKNVVKDLTLIRIGNE